MSGLANSSPARRSTIDAGRPGIGRLDGQLDPPADAHVVDPVTSRWGSEPSTARPWGSRMPARGMTATTKRNARHAMTSSAR